MLGKVLDDRWVLDNPLVPNDQLICDNHQGRAFRIVSGKVPDDRLVPNDPLICDDYQGKVSCVVSRKVPDNH